ncbi:hypothetical protein DSOUD_3543 [Desulfuromonas soudanensis]|uniref:Uncharacterized protein n=1 Tax=Desulfuromonas soudanensis TaxID=1603606 RepID=A0A0M4DLG7_9BACT|nr:hypothetical protein [Desulfuromonas soudanensis]ALC18257.1 hypothetical protein DSOUD_3543 [Desulfuromonas soudanensis]
MILRTAPLLLFFSLFACVPAGPPAPVPLDVAAISAAAAALPGVRIDSVDPLSLSYPGEILFARGAVLPLPGGPALLDPLAALIAAEPRSRWRGTVRSAGGESPPYDLALAEKRRELLERYLQGRGVQTGLVTLVAVAEEGPPLELTLLGDQGMNAAISSGVKP